MLNLTSAYQDGVELVFNYPTYIAAVDLTTEDAVILQADEENRFAQTLIAREDNQDSERNPGPGRRLCTSQEVYDFLDELAEEGHLRPSFRSQEE
ncbi:MAG: hypothetical protein U5K84_12110 [Alkalibacterium sp.]|nr:hypothetical protein [Alkalibacterium sp.]